MDKNIIKLEDTEIKKYKFLQHKNPFLIDNKNIDKKQYLKMSSGKKSFKYFFWL